MSFVEDVVDGLRSLGCAPRRNGAGWVARCPGHDDTEMVLTISASGDLECAAGCASHELLARVHEAFAGETRDPPEEQATPSSESSKDKKKPPSVSQSTRLVKLARARYRFASSTAGEPFAVALDGPNVARMLRGGRQSLRAELARTYDAQRRRAPSSSALADAMLVLEGQCSRHTEELHLRVARHGESLVVDQGDDVGHAIEIAPAGWRRLDRSSVLFRRTELTSALPVPEPGSDLEEVRSALHVSVESWPLVVAWLVAALIPDIPHPLLLLTGVQGSGKSTAQRRLAGLVDPSPAQLRAAPSDLDQWAVAASGSWVVPLDNLSGIQPWLSDALCRAATGDGLVKRRLYADESLIVLSFRRVISISSIDAGALRGDLADRLLIVDFERFAGGERRADTDLDTAWAVLWPRALGALYDLTASVLARLPHVHLDELPRMADYARVLAAVDAELGTAGLVTYRALGSRIAGDVVDADPVAVAIRDLAQRERYWRGEVAELLDEITPERPPKGWPADSTRLSGRIKRASSVLLALGIAVDNTRARGRRYIQISLEGSDAGDAGDAQLPFTSGSETAAEGDADPPGARAAQRHQRHPSVTPSVTPEPLEGAADAPRGDASDAPEAYSSLSNLEDGDEQYTEMKKRDPTASPASPASPDDEPPLGDEPPPDDDDLYDVADEPDAEWYR